MKPIPSLSVTSHQPSFFPWIGFWNKAANADVLILSGGVKLDYGGYQNRVSLHGSWVTLPILKTTKECALYNVRFDRAALPKIHQRLTQTLASKRQPNRELIRDILAVTFEGPSSDFLMDFNVNAFMAVANVLGIKPRLELDTTEPNPAISKSANLFARVRRHVKGPATYLAGQGQLAAYLDFGACPSDMRIMLQKLNERLDPNTILQSIAQSQDVATDVHAAATFEEIYSGQTYCCDRAAS